MNFSITSTHGAEAHGKKRAGLGAPLLSAILLTLSCAGCAVVDGPVYTDGYYYGGPVYRTRPYPYHRPPPHYYGKRMPPPGMRPGPRPGPGFRPGPGPRPGPGFRPGPGPRPGPGFRPSGPRPSMGGMKRPSGGMSRPPGKMVR